MSLSPSPLYALPNMNPSPPSWNSCAQQGAKHMIRQTLDELWRLAANHARTDDREMREDNRYWRFVFMEELAKYVRHTDPALDAQFAQLERQKLVLERGYDRKDDLGRLQVLAALDKIGDEWHRLVESVAARFHVPVFTQY